MRWVAFPCHTLLLYVFSLDPDDHDLKSIKSRANTNLSSWSGLCHIFCYSDKKLKKLTNTTEFHGKLGSDMEVFRSLLFLQHDFHPRPLNNSLFLFFFIKQGEMLEYPSPQNGPPKRFTQFWLEKQNCIRKEWAEVHIHWSCQTALGKMRVIIPDDASCLWTSMITHHLMLFVHSLPAQLFSILFSWVPQKVLPTVQFFFEGNQKWVDCCYSKQAQWNYKPQK